MTFYNNYNPISVDRLLWCKRNKTCNHTSVLFYSLLSDMFMLILYGVLRFMTPRDVRNAGSPDGSEISELMENNASWVVNRSKVIPSSAANPALRIKWWKAARPLRNRSVNCLIYFYSPSLQFIHAFEIRTGIAVATQETLMNTLGRENNNKKNPTNLHQCSCLFRPCLFSRAEHYNDVIFIL